MLCVFALTCTSIMREHFFALEPKEISDDKKRLKVKFYWLPQYQHSSSRVNILRTPMIPEDLEQDPRGIKIWNAQEMKFGSKPMTRRDYLYLTGGYLRCNGF